MPVDYFPVPVLQNGIKLTNEPPRGIKANLKRSFQSVEEAQYEACSKKRQYKKLFFGLCFFHAIVQERRKFGPLGWNIRYEFNDTDLETSTLNLRMFLDEQDTIPWGALLYVTGQINYGGRVTDDWDRRCLMTILGTFYTDKILSDDYKFSESGVYRAPEEGPLSAIKEYMEELPLTDPPEIFGMNENANITYQKQETENILETVLSIQPRAVDGGGGKTNDEKVAEIAQKIMQDTPGNLSKEDAKRTGDVRNGVIDSLTIVLLQEIERFNKLLNKMRSSLKNLQAAIKGDIVMSLDLDKMYSALLNNQVPLIWTKVAYPSLKPLAAWCVSFCLIVLWFLLRVPLGVTSAMLVLDVPCVCALFACVLNMLVTSSAISCTMLCVGC
jgi:dynein heavy chain